MSASKSAVFRELLGKRGTLLRPCAYDALSAILVEKSGFEVVGTTGYGIAASLIGQPDIGLVGFSEMLARARTIVDAVSIPVDVDIDTGYGNALNVYWTVKSFARIGAAGVRIEDQAWPKRCGHMAGKQLVSGDVMVRKIKAAVRARDEVDRDLVIGARTDARTVVGLREAVERGIAYAEAGADYIYVESPQSLEEVETLVDEIPGPLAFNIIPGGRTPPFKIEDLERIGVKYISVPMVCLFSATKAMIEALKVLRESRDVARLAEMGVGWAEFNDIVGLRRWRRLELEMLSEAELLEKYGTTELEEIVVEEAEGTDRVWRDVKERDPRR
ncbi:MAG: oxaloacetate decarboxylase [Candidatus Bathyarchaeia archaeon]